LLGYFCRNNDKKNTPIKVELNKEEDMHDADDGCEDGWEDGLGLLLGS